jgi:rubrerythrin
MSPSPSIRKKPAQAKRGAVPRSARRQATAAEEFYAQALAIERTAAERYRELAREMAGNGNVRTAELFLRLAHFETEHAGRLLEQAAGMKLPSVSRGRLSEAGISEIANYEFLYRRVPPQHALLMARAAERRAKAFFERTLASAADPAIRQLAAEFAREENEHIAWLDEALANEPAQPLGDLPD